MHLCVQRHIVLVKRFRVGELSFSESILGCLFNYAILLLSNFEQALGCRRTKGLSHSSTCEGLSSDTPKLCMTEVHHCMVEEEERMKIEDGRFFQNRSSKSVVSVVSVQGAFGDFRKVG